MEATLNFVLKSGIGLLALYLFYYALLRNQTSFRFNRLYLLLAPLVALTLPLITWPSQLAPTPAMAEALQAIQLSEVVVVAYRPSGSVLASYMTPASIALAIYGVVAAFLLLRLCRQLWHIHNLKATAVTLQKTNDGARIMQLQQPQASFAFLNYIYLSSQSQLSPREKQQVLAHELAHVQLGHTYDVLYYELLSAALWFNPVVWFLKQELRNVHEFQADARVLEQHQPQEYVTLLSKEVLFNMGLPVGSYFQKPQVLRRLHMLQQRGKQAGWARPLLTLPLLFVLFVVFAVQQGTDKASPAAPALFADDTQPISPQNVPDEAVPLNPNMVQMPQSETEASDDMPVYKEEALASMPQYKTMPQYNNKEPYAYVEQMPQFKGGEAEMMKFLAMKIRYPRDAQEAGIEGLVVLSFTVDEVGGLHDIQVLKPLSASTNAEAMRVVKQMDGNWEPGRQNGEAVPVRYTLPLRFTIK